MLEKKYKAKVEAMQIYVPLLTKLITKLEAKNDKSEENLEKISQLKILLQQLLDPKPGISFEELNECHQVMENLFKSNKTESVNIKIQTESTKGNNKKSNESKKKSSYSQRTISKSVGNEETTIEPENVEFIEFSEEEGNNSYEEEMILPDDEEDILQQNTENENNESDKDKDEDSVEINDSEKDSDIEILDYIKRSILSRNRKATEEIGSDESHKEIAEMEENPIEEIESEKSMQIEETEIDELDQESTQNKQMEELQRKIKQANENNKNNIIVKIVPKQSKYQTKLLTPQTNNDCIPSSSLKPTIKRVFDSNTKNITDIPVLKKAKTFQAIITETNATLKLIPEKGDDPLAVDTLNYNQEKEEENSENKFEETNDNDKNEDENKNNNDNDENDNADDDDDDIEIIENRSSPILIDSDDDDDKDNDVVEDVNENRKSDEITKVSRVELQPEINKTQPQQQRKIVISNVTSLSNKRVLWKKPITTTQQMKTQPNLRTNIIRIQKPSQPIVLNHLRSKPKNKKDAEAGTAQSKHSNIKLQLKQVAGPNPQLFVTKLGDRKVVIPNAFYGSPKPNDNPDAAHCRWLENFLRHFCSPYNIAHNTCFLLLQRALRQEDFLRIQNERANIKIGNGGEIDLELLRSLRTIFYINGDPVAQKLTFVGRKFCNLAFVNILDKTISLTVDSRTNIVTSRTRISAATLEHQQQHKTLETPVTKENLNTVSADISEMSTNPTSTTTIQTPAVLEFIPIGQTKLPAPPPTTTVATTSIVKQNKIVTDLKGIPATIIRIQPNKANRQSKEIDKAYSSPIDINNENKILSRTSATSNSNSMDNQKYLPFDNDNNNGNEDDDEVEFITGDTDCPSSNKINNEQVDLSAVIRQQDLSIPKKSINNKEKEKPSKSFEMAFIEKLAHEEDINRKQKALPVSEELIILDDDYDGEEEQTTTPKLPLEPYLLKERETLVKNTNASVNALSENNTLCLICNRSVSHIVGHYVNKHPDYEVYVSRPTAKFAKLLLSNAMGLAYHDRKRNDLDLFISSCAFCEKVGSFTFCYWYQHFASHTGEYAFKCTGCGIRKPTRSHLLSHLGHCLQGGSFSQIINHENASTKIIAYMCRLCHYTQMYCTNILKHLKNEHGLNRVDKTKWASVTLLQIPKSYAQSKNSENNTEENSIEITEITNINKKSTAPPIIIRDSNGDIFEIAEIEDGKSVAVDLTSNVQPLVTNEAEIEDTKWHNSPNDEIGDVEGIIQAYINKKN